MTVHRIRLRDFWTVTPLGEGRARHIRRFGRPRTLDPGETVWVTGIVSSLTSVTVNETPLGTAEGLFAFEVTTLLVPRNELVLDAAAGATVAEVALEVRPAATP